MERFNIIQPSAVLAPYIKHYWLLESDDVINSQRVIPTGNIELLFHRSCQMKCKDQIIPRTSLSGQSISFSDLTPTGVVNMIAVVFHPFGAKAFFELPIYELSNLIVSADDLSLNSLKELEDKILYTTSDDECIRLIESFLINRLNPFKEYNYKRMAAAVGTINLCSDELSVSKLAETVCLSKKQFQRIFSEYIGITPKEFMRIVRFHKTLYTLQNNPEMNFTTLAYECGFYDQAHLTREFKLFSGYTPGQYVAICRPYSDYFST
ncbi:helix-turn-helix domain-containing protein [Parabacteroides provencensis]|uniref:helix-turn-helix domain-containing protein n=1 Tax=Parabacteroides provencensis TaxID=1944636 RepID=UPI000C154BD5|nr:helix-turn-helix domain-containing protein [Parabacteroides provencensis]